MTLDMSKYLGIFLSESTEHLEALARDIVQLEKDGSAQVVDSMFRHAHSVKGMASSMGYEPIATLAHRIEDLVDEIRTTPSLLTRELVDLLLSATDVLQNQVRAVGAGQPPTQPDPVQAALAEKLEQLTGKNVAPTRVLSTKVAVTAPAAEPTPAPASLPAPGFRPRLALKFRVLPTCQVPGVRAFLVHKRLSGMGTVSELKPALDDLKAGRLPEGLVSLELETASTDAQVRAAISTISEVEVVQLGAVTPVAPPPIAEAFPPAAAQASTDAPKQGTQEVGRTVRVKTELLDYFLDTVGELLLATARIRQVSKALANPPPPLDEAVDRLHGIIKDLHDKVMSVRMTPLSVVTDRLPRAVRDIARKRGREVDLVITGAEIELDRAILDDLSDPLLHVLRNCIDHGIEPPEERVAFGKGARGRILISVRRQRDRVVVEMEDDGRGMDPDKLRSSAVSRGLLTAEAAERVSDKEALMLCCLPGVSTAANVSEISGRGVGMDAVKRTIENVGGTLEIESERGRGTRFILRLPLTVAVVNLLLVTVGEEIFGLPVAKVLGAVEADVDKLSRSRETPLLPHSNALLPVHTLAGLLRLPDTARIGSRPYVVMEGETGRVALAVDRLLGQEELVLKSLSRPLDLVPGLSGVTILGTGRPIFILDVPRLIAA